MSRRIDEVPFNSKSVIPLNNYPVPFNQYRVNAQGFTIVLESNTPGALAMSKWIAIFKTIGKEIGIILLITILLLAFAMLLNR